METTAQKVVTLEYYRYEITRPWSGRNTPTIEGYKDKVNERQATPSPRWATVGILVPCPHTYT